MVRMYWKVMRGDKVVKSVSDRGLMGGSPGHKMSVAHGHCLSLREIVSQREKFRYSFCMAKGKLRNNFCPQPR